MERNDLHRRIRRIVRRSKGQSMGAIREAICKSFGWYRPDGASRETSMRHLLRRLREQGLVKLPADCLKRRAPARREPRKIPENAEPETHRSWPQQCDISGEVVRERGWLVRPVVAEERRAWQEHMERFHYLGCGQLVVESMCYVASLPCCRVSLRGR